jgi:hypothetical protein
VAPCVPNRRYVPFPYPKWDRIRLYRPLTDANVQAALAEAVPRVFTARSDSAAHFHIDGLPSGHLGVVFQHDALNVLGLESPLHAIAIALDSSATVNLYIPSGATVTARRCSGLPSRAGDGMIAGCLYDSAAGGTS